jgi:hypothetical protein
MIPGLILSFVLSLLMGLAIVTLLWPCRRLQADLLTKVSLATGLGLGATSCLSFLYLVARGGQLDYLPVAEIVVLIALMTGVFLKHSPAESPGLARSKEPGPWTAAGPAAALALFLVGAATFGLASACWPHGDWDAWGIWNLHARFLYRGGAQWTNFLSEHLSWAHRDYPLLLPACVMRSWVFAGGETVAGPIWVAFVFMAGTALLLFSGLALLSGKLCASLATIVLVATPFFMGHAAAQYADVPLGFFYLATVVLFCLAGRAREAPGLLALAGLACGMAAWTKNEGLLFMVSALLARTWILAKTSGMRTCWRQMRPFVAGLLPVLLIILFFKIQYATPNDILGPAGRQSAMERVLTPSRYATIANWFLSQSLAFGKWDELQFFPISPVPLLLGALVLFGIKPDVKDLSGPRTAAWTLGLTLAGYLFILLITPKPLEWQLSSAGGRLLLQLWPSALFVLFMVLRDPLRGMSSRCDS